MTVKSSVRPLIFGCLVSTFFCAQVVFLQSETGRLLREKSIGKENRNEVVDARYKILIVDNDVEDVDIAGAVESDELSKEPPLCTREQIRQGHWKTFDRSEALYTAPNDWENRCSKRQDKSLGDTFQESEWTVADRCTFQPFNTTRLCEVLQNRTVAFLGDSISFQQYNSLAYLTSAKDVLRFKTKCFSRTCPNFTSKLYWMRDNQATSTQWNNLVRNVDPEVIVLNRGAHFTPTDELLRELNDTLHTALKWQEDCDARGRDCVLLWRTTAPGFPNCQQVPGPLDNAAKAEEIIANKSWYMEQEVRQKFHWWEFASQNQMVEDLIQDFRTVQKLRIYFLDFYDLAILRPDHHIDDKDCLHWCLPGPMDSANQLLLHQLEVANKEREHAVIQAS
eukprot:scaffold3914_cov121-Cylindrotheca_fusiformis.AAC.5